MKTEEKCYAMFSSHKKVLHKLDLIRRRRDIRRKINSLSVYTTFII